MIRLSIQTRQGLSRLTLPLLVGLSCALMIVSRLDPPLTEQLRSGVLDRLAPVYALLHRPVDRLRELSADAATLVDTASENRRLRAENRNLRRWYDVAVSLAAENAALKANLHWLPDPATHFVTARAVADAGGIYGRAVLLAAGTEAGLRKGEIAIDADGLAIFVIAAALRLARFNTMLELPDPPPWQGQFFTGMPAPAGAIVGLLPLYLQLSSFVDPNTHLPVPVVIAYVIFVAFLMASRIPHYSGKKIGRIAPEYFIVVLFGVASVLLLLATFPMEMMIVLSLCYLATTPFAVRQHRRLERTDAARRPHSDEPVLSDAL